jgi:hypothetical protein
MLILTPIPIMNLSLAMICLYPLKIDLALSKNYKIRYKNGRHDMDLPFLNAILGSATKLGKERWYGTATEKGSP